ncbi:hypothetical protein [Stygiolobus caldivivus]|uniref:Uncharacterized protein n=1 Tax=Stygiolobus caldivivus TaxID=2824673 RepID=A0A8D5U5S6_9CREN|nr:hypothetical protein [Stygiolobus caldivivus]BCU69590.1 hypothetical protein KN1_08870 [Stygiolobus caldivivus]
MVGMVSPPRCNSFRVWEGVRLIPLVEIRVSSKGELTPYFKRLCGLNAKEVNEVKSELGVEC